MSIVLTMMRDVVVWGVGQHGCMAEGEIPPPEDRGEGLNQWTPLTLRELSACRHHSLI